MDSTNRNPRVYSGSIKKKLVICIAVIGGLLAARHLNTVPDRNWVGGTQSRPMEVRTVNTLTGSFYRGYVKGEYINVESKAFSDVLDSVKLCVMTPTEKLAQKQKDKAAKAEYEQIQQECYNLLSQAKSSDSNISRNARQKLDEKYYYMWGRYFRK